MIPREQNTQTDQSRLAARSLCSLKTKDILKFASSLLLPLALGIFTVVITFQQQQAAKQQRDEDRIAAELQRDEDRNASQLQRIEDRTAAKQQREEDRNASQNQRDQERFLSEEKYENELLDTYVKEMGQLLKENNGSLTSNDVTATLARVKTLNIFRQLDSQRNSRIIRFLHEAKQLHTTQEHLSLDLSTAKLPGIDFRDLAVNEKTLKQLSLTDIFLTNTTCRDIEMEYVDFTRTHFVGTNFSFSGLRNVNFSHAHLRNVSFSSTQLKSVDFSSAELRNISFSSIHLENVHFDSAILNNTDFTSSQFENVYFDSAILNNTDFTSSQLKNIYFDSVILNNTDFTSSELKNVNFTNSSLFNCSFSTSVLFEIDFSKAKLKDVRFHSAPLRNVKFFGASLLATDLSSSRLDNVHFSSAQFKRANFSFAELFDVTFELAILSYVEFAFSRLLATSFSWANLKNVTFLSAIFGSVDFRDTQASETDFRHTTAVAINFTSAYLSYSTFAYANVKASTFLNAYLGDVNFSQANLYKADLRGISVTDEQLRSALSIENSILLDETLSHDTNLINNGHADCNVSLIEDWKLQVGNVFTILSEENSNDCRFALHPSNTKATMSQRVSLSTKWDSHFWPYSEAVLNASMSPGVSILLRGHGRLKNISHTQILDATQKLTKLLLSEDMEELEVIIEFNPPLNRSDSTSYWCDNITLFIIYGSLLEHTRVPLRSSWVDIHPNARWKKEGQTVGGQNPILSDPFGVFVAEDQTIYVADWGNHRIVAWNEGETQGQVVAGGNRRGKGNHQLTVPTDVIVDKESDSLLICDQGNKRVVRWPRRSGTRGETILSNIACYGLTMDDEGSLYVSDMDKHEVRRYRRGDSRRTVVAGGNGQGDHLDQLKSPSYLFVDREHSVFVSDWGNHRVMKWIAGAKEGTVVAGVRGQGDSLSQLDTPHGVVVDQLGTVYVGDWGNNRVVRWPKGAQQGMVVAGGNYQEAQADQLRIPVGLSFDRHGHLYVVDCRNNRVQKFDLEMSSK